MSFPFLCQVECSHAGMKYLIGDRGAVEAKVGGAIDM